MTSIPAIASAEAPISGIVLASGNPRADVAEAMGQCEAGQRVTVALRGSDLIRVVDLLQQAAQRLLPLVVRAELDDGHAGLFAGADTGACVLLAETQADVPHTHLLARLLAERALLPVLLACPQGSAAADPKALPAAAIDLLGDAADFVPSRTPAQELLFGKDRRRVVRWFDLERPVLRGQPAEPLLRTLQRAGMAPFVHSPVAELLRQVAADVQQVTGVAWSPARVTAADKAAVVVVGLADLSAPVAVELAEAQKSPRLGAVALHCLRPFPYEWVQLLRRKAAVLVLSGADTALAGDAPLLREVRNALARAMDEDRVVGKSWKDKERPTLHTAITGLGGAVLAPSDLAAFASECADGSGRALTYLGVEFAPLQGRLRKRTVLHEALRRGHPGVELLGLRTQPPAATAEVPAAPLRVETPAQQEPTHDNLTRSWDLLAAAMVAGAGNELAPDPYLTAGSTPALSSLFRGNRATDQLPAFDVAKCTGCGACWTACPDSALLPTALGAGELLEAGMRAAQVGGQSAEALRPVLSRLAKALPKSIEAGALQAGAALRHAAATVLAKVDAERKPPMQAAAEALAKALESLPLALCEPFFARVERERPGTGSLFVLALDADACKGCNLCVATCAPQALLPGARTPATVAAARATAAAWRGLPDTAGALIAAVRELPEPGLLGALQLSRHCLFAMAPGDDAEGGSGARIAVRSALATAEAHLQPKLQQHLQELDDLAADFGKRIRELLAGALPVTDLDALHEGLATLGMGAVALSTLATRLDQVAGSGRVDAAKLQRLVDTARAVADLRWRVHEGPTGRGRARAGVLFAGGEVSALAGSFPWNPLSAPAVLDDSADAGHRALGLMRAEADALCADFALLRRAKALLQGGAPGPRRLAFADLTDAEKALCPPLWLVADAALLHRGGLQQLAVVLDSDLPVKVLLVQQHLGADAHAHAALLALAHQRAFVLQSSISHSQHFASGLLAACRHQGPALLAVLAPSPRANGASADQTLMLAAAAVQSRALPLLRYDPSKPGAFGQKLSLDGNPDPTAAGTQDPQLLAEWQLLQELAGVRTPFTHDVELRAAADVAAAHRQELAALQQKHGEELQQARALVEAELLSRLQRKLTTLSGGRRS